MVSENSDNSQDSYNFQLLQEKISNLKEAILSAHPQIPTLLRTIHTELRAHPENVTLLSDAEIATVVLGLKKQTATEIVTAAVKSGGRKKKETISLDDL